jgi:FkbM family methyltransferase
MTRDRRALSVDLSSGMQSTVFFLGEYERAITKIIERLITRHRCKTFIDAGANFGWYTTLFRKYAGEQGSVHAFEPVPSIYDNLRRNFSLMGCPENVSVNNCALGDEEKEMTINLFRGLPTGHASLSTQGREDVIQFKCNMIRLDDYIGRKQVGDVDLIKVDIEGGELGLLRGANGVFKQKIPPIWLMEMALNQTKNFGYLPNDLIEYIRDRAHYNFYKIDEIEERLVKINAFDRNDIGANVICIPEAIESPTVTAS